MQATLKLPAMEFFLNKSNKHMLKGFKQYNDTTGCLITN